MENQNTKTSPPRTQDPAVAAANTVESQLTSSPPPSLSSSPTHEFSFSIFFNTPNTLSGNPRDLAPADDIFYEGHLLPLQFISQRNSDVSVDKAAFLSLNHSDTDENINAAATSVDSSTATSVDSSTSVYKHCNECRNPKAFSMRWLQKWLKGSGGEDESNKENQRGRRKKRMLAVLQQSLAGPFLFLRDWREKREIVRRRPHSFSGNGWRQRWRGVFSAPASSLTSRTNSGLLVAGSCNFSSEESTMEELQKAIQSAITHCKNSVNCR